MKNLILVMMLLAFSPMAFSVEYVIGLAEDYPSGFDKNKMSDAITSFVLKSLNPNDSLYIFDATKVKTLAEFKLGDKEEYKNPNVKRRKFAKTLLQVRDYINSLPEKPSSEVIHSLVNLPSFLKHLSTNKLDILKSEKVSILLISNALFQDSKETAFSVRDGWFPSDGHIKTDEKSSIFGTKNRQNYLKGVSFNHLVTNKPDEWQTDLYQLRIKRFWSLYITSQGGKYTTFTNDLDTAFERFAMPDLQPIESFEFDLTADKVEMFKATRTLVPSNESTADVGSEFMNDGVTISTQPPSKTKGLIKIGIKWSVSDADIDLYAKSNSAPEYLFFSNVKTDDGNYIKDFTSSPTTLNGLEQVEFTKEVEVSDLNVLVNFYGGNSDKGVDGTVRAFFDGKVYEKPFRIEANSGNSGADKQHASSSKNWAVIDVKYLLGL